MRLLVKFQVLLMLALFAFPAQATLPQDGASQKDFKMPLLDIVDMDHTPEKAAILTQPMERVSFPLTPQDKQFIEALQQKVLKLGAAGLAAPQVGVGKQIIAFQVPEAALKGRKDVTHLVPLTVFINPSYQPIEAEGRVLDWERCFSGQDHAGKVWRSYAITYEAQNLKGEKIQGVARGFLARLLQHEIDHCAGKLCFHQYDPESPQGAPKQLQSLAEEEVKQQKKERGLSQEESFPLQPFPGGKEGAI